MAYNGSGTFNRLYSWATDKVNSVKIQASRMDAEMTGFATGLSTCITKDGQTTITADIPMNAHKITGLAAAAAGTDALSRDAGDARFVKLAGSTMTGDLVMGAYGTVYDTYGYVKLNGGATALIINFDASDSFFYNRSTDTFVWQIAGGDVYYMTDTYFTPAGTDNTKALGQPGARWSVVYSATGAINTSDSTEKTSVTLADAVLRAAYRVPVRAFKFNDAIAEKGEANARVHYGFHAQDVAEKLTDEGIDPATQAFWCRDDIRTAAQIEANHAPILRQGLRYEEFMCVRREAERRVAAGTLTV